MLRLDPRLTFENFTVGPANRLACTAALRVAEAPGSAHNPLVIYGAPGLGKTHLLMAIGNRARQREPSPAPRYLSIGLLLDGASDDGVSSDPFGELRDTDLLLLDDLQLIGGRADAQAGLAVAWDAAVAAGGQVVLASDRPTRDIAGLEVVLGPRFARGLVVDLAPPEHETRLRIVQAKVAMQEQALADGVANALARLAFGSVRELYAGLNRVLAAQELEGRLLRASEVPELLGIEPASAQTGEAAARDDATAHNGVGAHAAAAAAPSHADRSAGAMLDGGAVGTVPAEATTSPEVGVIDRWFLSPEKVVWRWPYIEDAIVPDER